MHRLSAPIPPFLVGSAGIDPLQPLTAKLILRRGPGETAMLVVFGGLPGTGKTTIAIDRLQPSDLRLTCALTTLSRPSGRQEFSSGTSAQRLTLLPTHWQRPTWRTDLLWSWTASVLLRRVVKDGEKRRPVLKHELSKSKLSVPILSSIVVEWRAEIRTSTASFYRAGRQSWNATTCPGRSRI